MLSGGVKNTSHVGKLVDMKTDTDLERFSRRSVLVIGDVMLDRYLWGVVQRISPEAPVPVFRVTDRSEVLGGAGNVAANLSGLGCSAHVIGVCGLDAAGERVMELMDEKGIAHTLYSESLCQTTTKTRIVAQKQQIMRLDEEESQTFGIDLQERIIARIEKTLPNHQAVILSDYGKGVLQSPGITERIISICRQSGIPVLVDPKGADWDRYRGATCVTPNAAEMAHILGHPLGGGKSGLASSVRAIQDRYQFENLLVTRGENGLCLVDADGEFHIIAARSHEVYDVSGAGDTVIATLGAAIACDHTLAEAAALANEAAGIVVTKVGTQPIRRDELAAAIGMGDVSSKRGGSRKIAGIDAARLQMQAWHSSGEEVVFANGCFDLLHPGHIHLLRQARDLGDRLIVGLNADASVRRLKGPGRPILCESDRSAILAALSGVDMVVIFGEDTPLGLIEALKPDILVKGSDYRPEEVVGREAVESYGGKVEIVELLAGSSTTGLVDRITRPSSDYASSPSVFASKLLSAI